MDIKTKFIKKRIKPNAQQKTEVKQLISSPRYRTFAMHSHPNKKLIQKWQIKSLNNDTERRI
ncbi:hypothetical protein AEQU3_03107 [Aequorivita antarctica]|nr:hypothetical protein AEQU3_03107 [Aequorivita antarctica]